MKSFRNIKIKSFTSPVYTYILQCILHMYINAHYICIATHIARTYFKPSQVGATPPQVPLFSQTLILLHVSHNL